MRLTNEQYNRLTRNKPNKYHNEIVESDNIKFDSKKERDRYYQLKTMERFSLIKDLVLQPRFELQPSFTKDGINYRKIEYVADFSYYDINKGIIVVEDVKGMETEVFKIKHKMFEYKYPDLSLKIIK